MVVGKRPAAARQLSPQQRRQPTVAAGADPAGDAVADDLGIVRPELLPADFAEGDVGAEWRHAASHAVFDLDPAWRKEAVLMAIEALASDAPLPPAARAWLSYVLICLNDLPHQAGRGKPPAKARLALRRIALARELARLEVTRPDLDREGRLTVAAEALCVSRDTARKDRDHKSFAVLLRLYRSAAPSRPPD